MTWIAGLIFISCATSQTQEAGKVALKPIAKVDFKELDEISGIVKSRQYKDTYWVHNDSGDSSRIFAINSQGEVLFPGFDPKDPTKGRGEYEGIKIKKAANRDWEDIALDGKTMYISDCGNNANQRTDLGIYKLQEPNPLTDLKASHDGFIPVAYPDQKEFPPKFNLNFDCEAIFVLKGKVHFITKHRLGKFPANSASLYRLDDVKPNGAVNTLTKLDSKEDMGGWVTGADLSPDGKTLAVLTHLPTASVWLFDVTKGDKIFSHPIKQVKFTGGGQTEAICWDDATTVRITNEPGDIFSLKVR